MYKYLNHMRIKMLRPLVSWLNGGGNFLATARMEMLSSSAPIGLIIFALLCLARVEEVTCVVVM